MDIGLFEPEMVNPEFSYDEQLKINVAVISSVNRSARYEVVNVIDGLVANKCLINLIMNCAYLGQFFLVHAKHQLTKSPTSVYYKK